MKTRETSVIGGLAAYAAIDAGNDAMSITKR
jgi:hypothetical protein